MTKQWPNHFVPVIRIPQLVLLICVETKIEVLLRELKGHLIQGLANIPVKSQTVNNLGFTGQEEDQG